MILLYLLGCEICRVQQSELNGWYTLTQETNEGSCADFTSAVLHDFRIENGKPMVFEDAYGQWCNEGTSTWNSEECSNTYNWSCGDELFVEDIDFFNQWVVTSDPRDPNQITVELYILSVYATGIVDCESNYLFTGTKHGAEAHDHD